MTATKTGNYACPNPCQYYKLCKLNAAESKNCKAHGHFSPYVFGRSWEQIQTMQQREGSNEKLD